MRILAAPRLAGVTIRSFAQAGRTWAVDISRGSQAIDNIKTPPAHPVDIGGSRNLALTDTRN
jgi:hypothetical protein